MSGCWRRVWQVGGVGGVAVGGDGGLESLEGLGSNVGGVGGFGGVKRDAWVGWGDALGGKGPCIQSQGDVTSVGQSKGLFFARCRT